MAAARKGAALWGWSTFAFAPSWPAGRQEAQRLVQWWHCHMRQAVPVREGETPV